MSFVRFHQAGQVAQTVVEGSDLVLPADAVAHWQAASAALAAAQTQAERILADAKTAFEAERQRGYAEGLEQAQFEQTDKLIEHASRMVDHLAAVEQRMVTLVMQAVRRIMADFDDSKRVMAVVENGLAVLRNQKQLTLRVSPAVVDTVRGQAAGLLERFPGVGMIDIVADPRLKGDATILESEIGLVEASVERQILAIEQAFMRVLGSRV